MKLVRSRVVLWGGIMIAAGTVAWGAVRLFDHTQAGARDYVARAPVVVGRIGVVEDVVLYKVRYMDPRGTSDGCFAAYYFFVSGASGNAHLRTLACGSRAAPEFRVQDG